MTGIPTSASEIRVLVVEDNADHAHLLERLLGGSAKPRFAVELAESVAAARQKLEGGRYEVVLLDLSLPDSVGVQTFERVSQWSGEAAVIVLSGTLDVSVALEALHKGAQDYLVKGHVDAHLLFRSIQYAIERKQTQLELKRACGEMEACVRQRTSELSQTNERLRGEVEERKRAEKVALESNQQLVAALEELRSMQRDLVRRERFEALAHMAKGIAHEFNNVLTPIVGFAEHLLKHPAIAEAPEAVRRNLEKIRTAALAGSKAVARVRDFARAEAGEMGRISVDELLESVVTMTEPKWRNQALAGGATISVARCGEEVPDVRGDPLQLREALTHLIFNATNAIKRRGLIQVGGERRPDGVAIFVRDDGRGMSESQRRHCLDPKAVSAALDRRQSGYAKIHSILARHHGRLEIESREGVGTKVGLVLPLEPEGRTQTPKPVARVKSKGLRILVADDEPMVREVISICLTEDGHEVVCAEDGAQALEAFRKGRFDLVLTDRAMPHLSGDQLAVEVKGMRPEVPVILLTGFGDLMNAEGEKPKGIDTIVSKPFTIASLRAALAQLGLL